MRIEYNNDNDRVRIADMNTGRVFRDGDRFYLVTDEWFTEDWERAEEGDDSANRLCVNLDGVATTFDPEDEYELVDGAFVEGA